MSTAARPLPVIFSFKLPVVVGTPIDLEADGFENGDVTRPDAPMPVLVEAVYAALEAVEWDMTLLEQQARLEARKHMHPQAAERISHLLEELPEL